MLVRTRFAPSPTGFLHVGSVRTALFSWLFARHHKGEFILRIEDTDHERSTEESVQAILDGMAWLGLEGDTETIYQTDRYHRYQSIAKQLLDEGHAYRCVCSKERLESLRESQLAAKQKPRYDGQCREKNLPEMNAPYVIRFKTPHIGHVSFSDQVYGEIQVENAELDDLILMRSDGHPTYNFAVVIDDWDMEITHVIRGDDHLNNTPRQINLFHALNAPVPIFAHLPMILGDDGKRLSKRHGAVNVLQFKEEGILPEALLNYLVRLGWSHGDQEIFSLSEMIQLFDLRHVSRSGAGFSYDKLHWLNHHYIKALPPKQIALALEDLFKKRDVDISKGPSLEDLISLQADRCKNLIEICDKSLYFYQEQIQYDEDAVKKHLRPVTLEPLMKLHSLLQTIKTWDLINIQKSIQEVCEEFQINMGKIGQPLRVAVTGTGSSPAIDLTLVYLGKERTIARLEYALMRVRERKSE
jgi:glutamyl-tRNA synthetase